MYRSNTCFYSKLVSWLIHFLVGKTHWWSGRWWLYIPVAEERPTQGVRAFTEWKHNDEKRDSRPAGPQLTSSGQSIACVCVCVCVNKGSTRLSYFDSKSCSKKVEENISRRVGRSHWVKWWNGFSRFNTHTTAQSSRRFSVAVLQVNA